MSNSSYPVKISQGTIEKILEIVLPEDIPSSGELEFGIKIDDEEVNLAELSEFLAFVDRTYGRLSEKGIRSYAQSRDNQATVSFKEGSLEIVLKVLAEHGESVAVLWLILKYAPVGLENLTTAYKNFQDATLTRMRRKQLKEQMKADKKLAKLDNHRLNQMVRLLDEIYQREDRSIPRVRRFVKMYLRDLKIRTKKD